MKNTVILSGWTDKEGASLTYEPLGVFESPCGNFWSNQGYTKEERSLVKAYLRDSKIRDKIIEHLIRTDRSINTEMALINSNVSTLPRYCKDWLSNLNFQNFR